MGLGTSPSRMICSLFTFGSGIGDAEIKAWGKLLPARTSLEIGGLPIGLANGVPLTCDVHSGQSVTWADVRIDENDATYRYRHEMERAMH